VKPDHLDGQLILAEVVADLEDGRNGLVVLGQEGQLQRQRVRREVGGRPRVDPASHQPGGERDQGRVRVPEMLVQLRREVRVGAVTLDRLIKHCVAIPFTKYAVTDKRAGKAKFVHNLLTCQCVYFYYISSDFM